MKLLLMGALEEATKFSFRKKLMILFVSFFSISGRNLKRLLKSTVETMKLDNKKLLCVKSPRPSMYSGIYGFLCNQTALRTGLRDVF